MSIEEDRWAPDPHSHAQDVSRAWDSLLEAKHVLQRIENKVDIQNQHRKQAQKIRRRLQLERSSFPGPDSYSSVINDSSHRERRPKYQREPDETFTLHSEADFSSKMDIPWDHSSRRRPTSFLQQDKPSMASFDDYHIDNSQENILAKSNQENFNNGQLTALRGYSEEHVSHVPKTSNLGLQTCTTGDIAEEMGNDYQVVTYPPSAMDMGPEVKHSLSPETITPTPYPMVDLYEQKLEHLKRKSPKSKLEKLKERIQEQKKRQDLSKRNQTKSGQNTEVIRKPPLKRKVCKVTFGPPATSSRGFSAAEEKSVPVNSKEDTIKREKENLKKESQKSEGDTAFRCSRAKTKVLKSKSPVIRKLSFKSPSPERKGKHSDLYGASAWREGQRRIQQILGPSPITLRRHHSPKSDDLHTIHKGRCRRCHKMVSPDRLICNQHPDIHEFMKGIIAGAQVIPDSSPEEHRSRPSGKESGKDREKPRERSRSKSLSPKRPHAMYNHMEEGVQYRGSKKRSYSVEQIRDFMKKKATERQKMEQENQMKRKKALQARKEQLDNVLKKQKEAFPPRREAISTAVSRKKTPIKPYDRINEGKNLSEWLHVTSSDLLREDDGASSRSPKKQKTRILPKDEHSSPLRIKDLVPVPTVSQDIQVKGTNFSKGLNDDDLPSYKTADVSSQCRTHQERLHAIWTTAKDLGRRVELECSKLGSPNLSQHLGTSVSSPSPCSPSQMMSASGKYPVVVEPIAVQVDKTFQEHTRKTPVDKEHNLPTSADIGLYWTPDSTKVSTGPLKKKTKEFTGGTFQTKKLNPKVLNEKAQKSGFVRRSTSTSPHRRSDVSSPRPLRDASLSPPRRKTASPQRTASPPYSDKKGKRGKPQHAESSSPVKRMEVASKIRAQLQQQEKDLAALRLKAEMEAKEAQRCLEEMLRHNKQRGPGLQITSEKHGNRNSIRQESEKDWLDARSEARMESDKRGTGSVTRQNGTATAHGNVSTAAIATESLERSWDHTEPATDSTSKWSEVGEFYGSPNMFARFTLEMSQQYIREEELRARHQTALLRLREEALKEKTKAELALLNHQKIYWESKNEPNKMEELVSQELEIQKNLKEEQAEIRHLQNVYKAAHQERKLLLRQQKEILRIQQSAAHIQHKLHKSGVTPQVSELIHLDPSPQQSRHGTFHKSTLASAHLNQDTQSSISELSEDDDITEKTQPTETYQVRRAEDGGTSPGPEVRGNSTLRRSVPQGRGVADEEKDYFPDGSAEGNALSGSPQNNRTSPCRSQEDQHNRSTARRRDGAHEETSSADQKGVTTSVNIQDLDRVAAGESRVSLRMEDRDKEREPTDLEGSEELKDNANIMSTTQQAANDDQLVIERTDDHNSQSISVPSKSNTRTLSPSLPEFQKVSAKLINISESSPSASDRGQAGEDTESGDSEVFDMESSEFPPRGPLDLESGENLMANGDKSKPTSSPTKPPDCRKPVILVMKETQSKTEMAPLACESFPTSEDLTESDTKTYGINHLPENQDGSVVRITDIHKSTSMSPKDDGNAARMSSPDTKDRQGVTETNEKQSFTKSAIFRKIEMMPSHTTASKDLSQIKSFPHRSEGDDIFIMDEVLQPIDDTLSEILSPIDEKLSYESADLYSPQQDQSEELPSLPRDASSIKSGESDTEDFPTPPEEILLSRSESLQSSREASLIEEIHLLYDSLLTEDSLLPPDEIIKATNSPLETENSRLPEVIQPCRPFLTLSKAEDDIHDPLSTFEIGDRVLVKLSKPGTLMYKGLTSFKEGYWAGVALDKPEGDNDGTYEGIRYFECSKNCGVFVRPGQISHLLFDELDGSNPKKDKDDDYSFGDGPSPGDVQKHDEGNGDTSSRHFREKNEGKWSSEKGTNQSRSCSLKTSENINDLQEATISSRCFHAHAEGLLVESKNPGQTLQIKHFCRGDINKLIVPNPSQDDKHRLLLKVTDELISRVLLDAIGTYSKISAPEKVSVMNSSTDEKCMVAEEGFCHQLLSVTTRQAGGYVDTLVTEVINDCIEDYQQIRRKKGKENTSLCYGSPFLAAGEDRTSSLRIFTDGIFEELVKDSLQGIETINCSRAQSWPTPVGGALPSRKAQVSIRTGAAHSSQGSVQKLLSHTRAREQDLHLIPNPSANQQAAHSLFIHSSKVKEPESGGELRRAEES